MKIDLYTKVILTIIALCLVVLTISQTDFFTSAKADPSPWDQQISGARANLDGSLNVRVIEVSAPMNGIPVEIKRNSTNNVVPVEVRKVSYPSSGVPVEVKNRYIPTKPY